MNSKKIKSKNNYEFLVLGFLVLLLVITADSCFARSLDMAVKTLSERTLGIAQNASLFGVAIGAIMSFFPWMRHHGTSILQAAGLAAVLSFGAPALLDFLKSAFN
jgi:hypothetical protein